MSALHSTPARLFLFLLVILVIGGLMTDAAQAAPRPVVDKLAIEGILGRYQSPLPYWTIEAFADSHPDFDIAGYLTVAWCESSLGTTGKSFRFNNPGNIMYHPKTWAPEKVWYTWQTGGFKSAGRLFGAYESMYMGQRALIRLLYDHPAGYNTLLREHRWDEFGRIYYGPGEGLADYIRNLKAAHALILKEAAKYGATW